MKVLHFELICTAAIYMPLPLYEACKPFALCQELQFYKGCGSLLSFKLYNPYIIMCSESLC